MSAAWLRLVDIATPVGGAVVAIAEIYVDESGSHDGSPILSIGGYVFMRSKAKRFASEWSRHLRKRKIPHFHMTDCAINMGQYRDWTKDECIEHEKALIALIKSTAAYGFSVAISEQTFYEKVKDYPLDLDPYSFLLTHSLLEVRNWMKRAKFKGAPAFFFESGHQSASLAARQLESFTRENRGLHPKLSYTFVSKDQAPPLQAADLLAWLTRNSMMKSLDGKVARRDFAALVANRGHTVFYYDEGYLDALIARAKGDLGAVDRHLLTAKRHNFLIHRE